MTQIKCCTFRELTKKMKTYFNCGRQTKQGSILMKDVHVHPTSGDDEMAEEEKEEKEDMDSEDNYYNMI